ncbi:MAG: TonB-dependent receptor [Bacteroidales bacterium]|nr:TonB-dependent receptor [Bacteroidales bacterium]
MKKTFIRVISVAAMLMLSLTAFAQKHQVSGKVIDASNGDPVIGAGVLISSGGGVVTDYDGNYTLEAADDDVLTFSSIGFESVTMKVDGRRVIDVSMQPDSQLLEEVVVLGYTTQKKAELSSAVVTMGGEKLRDVSTADVGNMLQGKVAGVVVMNSSGQPGDNADIRIRGTGSITAGAGPLYVVDGVAGGSFNPNDIETITVLKDASATALYGAAASGGVIVVTTKGASQENTIVNFKASVGIKRALTGRFHAMDGEELYDYIYDMYDPVIFGIVYEEENLWEKNFDWVNNCFKTGAVQNYFVSASGKAGKVSYYASLDHYKEDGTLINTNFKRNAARVNLSFPVTDRLTVNMRVNYQKSNTQGTSSWVTLENAYYAIPWDNPYDENTGELLFVNSSKRSDNGLPWYSAQTYNILHNEQYNYSRSHGEDLMGDLQFIWTVNDWLTLTSTNRYDSSNSFGESYIDPRTNVPSIQDKGYLSNSDGEWNSWGTTNLAKFHKSFGSHELNAIAGWEYGEGYSRSMDAEGDHMPNGQRSLSNTIMYGIGGVDYHTRTWALLGQTQYSYLGKYVLTASIRYDESYKFGKNARGGFFPGVSGAWIISKENFLMNNKDITFLKLRAGYGKTGNDNIPAFQYQDTYSLSGQYNSKKVAVLERLKNDNLGWEEAFMTSVGVDATLFNNINFTIDYYNTVNKKLLLEAPTPPSTGFFSYMSNVGEVRNNGVEMAMDWTIIGNQDLTWTAGINLGFNKNRVVELPEHRDMVMTKSEVSQIITEGRDVYSWYMPKWYGVDPTNGEPLWYTGNGDEVTNDYSKAKPQIVGSASPLFSGGLNTAVHWKNFTLSANGNFVVGNKIYNKTRAIMDSDGMYPSYNQMSHNNGLGWVRWTADDPSTWDIATHPEVVLKGNNKSNSCSSRYLEDGSFFRVRNVTLSYDLPENLIGKMKMSGARVYVSADNVLTLTRFSGMDPEVRLDADTYSHAGLYSNNYPVPFSLVLGLDVKF